MMKKNKDPKDPFTLTKVIDPHKNMPKNISSSLFAGVKMSYDYTNNDTFMWWTVGEYQYATADVADEDLDCDGDRELKKVDDWMLQNDLTKGERVLVLYWW